MSKELIEIKVPDIGGAEDVGIIELLVSPGDTINVDDSIMTLESDKATMDIPSPVAGVVESVEVAVGDKVSEGSLVLKVASEQAAAPTENNSTPAEEPAAQTQSSVAVNVPDIGTTDSVKIIEVLVKAGDSINEDDSLITLESDKATMDVPSPYTGVVESIDVAVGGSVAEGDLIAHLTVAGASAAPAAKPSPSTESSAEENTSAPMVEEMVLDDDEALSGDINFYAAVNIHAGPAVRRLARELGVDLTLVKGTGQKRRIIKQDIHKYVKSRLQQGGSTGGGLQVEPPMKVDFNKFGETERVALTRIQKISGRFLHRNWVTIPHVTQFGQADITDMEAFRQQHKQEAIDQGFRLTPLAFIMKAAVGALKAYPKFNSSLDNDGEHLIMKKYFHVGVAVDTPNGLVVAVVRDVDQKGINDIAKELFEISNKARKSGLSPSDMQGSCFTISSLGGIGGSAFTPIVNAPDVAILGVSKASMQPVYDKKINGFIPRLMLPLSLSYDHRVIDGADGARFMVSLENCLTDLETLLL